LFKILNVEKRDNGNTLLTFFVRKLEYQQELVFLLVQAVNYDFLTRIFIPLSAKAKKLT
jgi:hypothetical protein